MEEEKEKTTPESEEATTVGMFLKYTRLKQKKSIEAVSDTLCIRRVYIKALEEDDYETLPPIPYGVGFVRSYASYLGLNADRIVQFYKQQAIPSKEKEKTAPVIVKKHTEITMPNKKHIYIGLAAIVLLYALWVIFRFVYPQQQIETEQVDEQVIEVLPVNEEPEDVSSFGQEQETNEGDVSSNSLKSETEDQIVVNEGNYVETEEPVVPQNRVKLKVKGDSWIEVKDAEKVYISGIYHKGFEYDVPSAKGMILSIGNHFNVDVYVDDQLIKVTDSKRKANIKLDDYLKH